MTELPKRYDFKASEQKWMQYWEEHKVFAFDTKSDKERYVVDTPPPTVSGDMHLGHAFSYAQQDFNVRFQRMLGKNVFFPFGTDDNGLPTERLVEKLRRVQSKSMERGAFISLCHATLKDIKPKFVEDWKRLGMSCDFNGFTYSTIDPYCVKTAQESFLDLLAKDLVYQHEAPTMWCVKCQTAIAQAELDDMELSSTFNDIVFKLCGSKDTLLIATTRPELLCACACIFVHPNDARYTHLVGKSAIVPLFNHEVPILADESADPDKGTGILMICSYGDRFDVDALRRHKIDARIAFTKDGRLNDRAGRFQGQKIQDARKAILGELDARGLLKESRPIKHMVNVHERCSTEVEFLSTKQWFVRIVAHKDAIKEKAAKIKWYPASMKKRFDNWVDNLNWDWCISRQRHFGVSIPVWYSKKTGEIITAQQKQLPCDPLEHQPLTLPEGHTPPDLAVEQDVFDTWFTSSLTPQIITNWVRDKRKEGYLFDRLFPTDLRPQAHDIIRTWAFYTIVKALHHHDQVPWKDIVISGHVLARGGEKMSKSKGNAVAPQDMVEKYGADALRFWAAGSRLGDDLPFMEKDLITGQKTVTKLWNAMRFCLMHLTGFDPSDDKDLELTAFDQYVLHRFYVLADACKESFSSYEYARVKADVEQFFFSVFCDYYLEICKDRLFKEDVYGKEARRSAQYTLYHLMYGCIRIFAPFMPFITEELYHAYFQKHDGGVSVHRTLWPSYAHESLTRADDELGDLVLTVVSEVRKYKSDHALALNAELETLHVLSKMDAAKLGQVKPDLLAATKAKDIVFGDLPSSETLTSVMVRI